MNAKWDVGTVDGEKANALQDAYSAVERESEADFATIMAAIALNTFNACGYGGMAKDRGFDVNAEVLWFMETFLSTIGSIVEQRYGGAAHHVWCNYMMKPGPCAMCVRLYAEYPYEQGEDAQSAGLRLMVKHFPDNVRRT